MPEEKPLTIANLIAALKESGLATKDDLKKLRGELREDFLQTLAEFQRGEVDPKIDKLRMEMRKGFMQVNSRLENVENQLRWLKDDIDGLKADLSTVPSRQEFEKLKTKIDAAYPVA